MSLKIEDVLRTKKQKLVDQESVATFHAVKEMVNGDTLVIELAKIVNSKEVEPHMNGVTLSDLLGKTIKKKETSSPGTRTRMSNQEKEDCRAWILQTINASKKPLALSDLEHAAWKDTQIRNQVGHLVDEKLLSKKKDPNHSGKGKAPLLYSMTAAGKTHLEV